ncbi:winged helix-turn-helix domain-containing protein [Desulfosoma caldarium]|uniref:Molybdate transport system regulatory protein n=1 Tax=Desulfosoma caldarium TaxID=610254 RepID=A0A3N1UXZ7_9BACT|nr:LysR family transcriptional regulator [Desulfosoma caldarium]ROQ93560.1 molybdate transport system regulatory protein [Desulfosoma caldarium]
MARRAAPKEGGNSVGLDKKLIVHCKVWVEDDTGALVFGAGRLRILEAVERAGSIIGAAKELGMSYSAVWGKIRATEERLGCPVLNKKIGGIKGGGSALTPFAKDLLERFRTLEERTQEAAERIFEDIFGKSSLPGSP